MKYEMGKFSDPGCTWYCTMALNILLFVKLTQMIDGLVSHRLSLLPAQPQIQITIILTVFRRNTLVTSRLGEASDS
jgi:hypothetical protein